MTSAEKILLVKTFIGMTTMSDSAISDYLDLAADEMIEYMGAELLPPKFDKLHCKLASRMILRRGTEGERQHNESGSTSVNRVYDSVDDADIFARLPRYCGVV